MEHFPNQNERVLEILGLFVIASTFLLHFSKHFNDFIEALGITTARTLEPHDVHLGIYPKMARWDKRTGMI